MTSTKFNALQICTLIVLLVLVAATVFLFLNRPKIAYVRSHDLIEKYQGTLEARAEFEKKKNGMSSNVDSLKIDFERAKNQYLKDINSLSPKQRSEKEEMLTFQQEQLVKYSEAVLMKVQEEDNKMMQEVLNQVNSFIEEYAKTRNYSLILGTTLSGSLLYGEQAIDITDQLLLELNNRYKGKQ